MASPAEFGFAIKVMPSPPILEPGVFGVLRPVLVLPEGLAARLTPEQLESVLAHELCHVRRRHNLMEEPERACDEEVLRLGNKPEVCRRRSEDLRPLLAVAVALRVGSHRRQSAKEN